MNSQELKLMEFISKEKEIFKLYNNDFDWENEVWDAKNWLPHRGHDSKISFNTQSRITKSIPDFYLIPEKSPLPSPFIDFTKAMAVYLQRTKGIQYMAVRNYVNESRRIHLIMFQRGECHPQYLTREHFEQVLDFLDQIEYKMIYDVAANLQVIAEVIDKKELTQLPINFKHGLKNNHQYFNFKTVVDFTDDEKRKEEEKLPSYEAMAAYAQCTNSPINDNEEILLRTIDLLIAMGQRGNEVTFIPFDCWVEKEEKDKNGNTVTDAHGRIIKKIGIKYFAEKQFQSRVHWFAEQDIPFARRAVDRLKILTEEPRIIAKWQEENPGKLWELDPDKTITDDELLNYFGFKIPVNLQLHFKNKKINPVFIDSNHERKKYFSKYRSYSYIKRYHYKIKDIESIYLPRLSDHGVLKEKVGGKWKTILKTSEVLSISFEGSFRFKERGANVNKLFPQRTTLKDINGALGGYQSIQSIFERRKLTEADGTNICITSHQPRHWRNTLYELAGMTNVQQALALGRQRIDQNTVYQHTTLKERTQSQRDFIAFNSINEKVTFLHEGIRDKKIIGSITETYHFLIKKNGIDSAENFLKTHALALHITPFGGCTHDFSQAPCPKHLQCWNGCSHLHRTGTPGETEKIKAQLELSIKVLDEMKKNSDEYGSDVWIKDHEKKIENLKKGLNMNVTTPTKVFPEGTQMTIPLNERKSSSVSE